MARSAKILRQTNETDISVDLSLEPGEVSVSTDIGFFDHMLKALAFYAGFTLKLNAHGDVEVDGHHTVEDVGICLGTALKEALGSKLGIRRFSSCFVPMDEALCFAALDISGRPFLVCDAPMPQELIGGYDSCLTVEFMRALAFNAGLTLHIKEHYGDNAHHITEAIFKAVGLALKEAVRVEGEGVSSTKGVL